MSNSSNQLSDLALLLAVYEHKQIVRNMMSVYGNSSTVMFEYNIGVGSPKSFRGYAAKLEDRWV